ncbi:MAG: DUF6324 family protein [Deltaproteobacteria bacterium]
MGINKESDVAANLQIGPTNLGMVRIYVAGEGIDLPFDFEPDEADEIAEELRLAAEKARAMTPANKSGKSKPDHPKGPRSGPPASKPRR